MVYSGLSETVEGLFEKFVLDEIPMTPSSKRRSDRNLPDRGVLGELSFDVRAAGSIPWR